MVDFTLADLARTLREVAAERPDYVYEGPGLSRDCFYLHGNEPGCLFGHALTRLGVRLDPGYEGQTISFVLSRLFHSDTADPEFAPFQRVQALQDGYFGGRRWWAECVKALDTHYPL